MLPSIVGGSIFAFSMVIVVIIAMSIKHRESKLQYNANGCQLGPNGQPISKPIFRRGLFGVRRIVRYDSCILKTSMVSVYAIGIFISTFLALGGYMATQAANSPTTYTKSSGSSGGDWFGSLIVALIATS